jgi:tRNA G26 N,N-dimethylase Trm1
VNEGKAKVMVTAGKHTPEKTVGYYHTRMSNLRDYLIVSLSAVCNTNNSTPWIILDPFASTGVFSLRILKEIENIKARFDISRFQSASSPL